MNQAYEIGGINIVLHPHPVGQYEKLFRAVNKLRRIVRVHGDKHALMTNLSVKDKGGKNYALEGEISSFSHLDPELPWINLETEDDASDEELTVIPEHLRPNLRRCYFYFDVGTHKMFFLTTAKKGGMSSRLMEKYLNGVFSDPGIVGTFGTPRVTILPDRDSVSQILKWNKIRRLEIHAERPNPGDYDPEDLEAFEKSLSDQNVMQMNVELVAEKNKSLVLSDQTKKLVAIAADNGYVEAKGYKVDGTPEERSTKSGKPFSERVEFDADNQLLLDSFVSAAKAAVRKFIGR